MLAASVPSSHLNIGVARHDTTIPRAASARFARSTSSGDRSAMFTSHSPRSSAPTTLYSRATSSACSKSCEISSVMTESFIDMCSANVIPEGARYGTAAPDTLSNARQGTEKTRRENREEEGFLFSVFSFVPSLCSL